MIMENQKGFARHRSWQIWTASIIPLLSTKTPVFVDRQYKNQLLSMKSWILVDRMLNNRNFTLSPENSKQPEFYVEPIFFVLLRFIVTL